MKCKIFIGTWYEAQDAFNNWAKGKALTKEVLIHEQIFKRGQEPSDICLIIIVYHPEDEHWDKTEKTLTAPVHDVPIPHIKIEEIKVTP